MKLEIPFRTSTESLEYWERSMEDVLDKKPPISRQKMKDLIKSILPKTCLKPRELKKVVESEREIDN